MVEVVSFIVEIIVVFGFYALSIFFPQPIGALFAGAKEGDFFVLGGSYIFISLLTVFIGIIFYQFFLFYILSHRKKSTTLKQDANVSDKERNISIREVVGMVLNTKFRKGFFIILVVSLCLCLVNGIKINHNGITHSKFFTKASYRLSDIRQIDIDVTLKKTLSCEINLCLENAKLEIWHDSLSNSPSSEELIKCLDLIVENAPTVRITYNYEPTASILDKRAGSSRQAIIDIYNWALSHNATRVD